jgi:hypothetical protein
MKPARKKLSDVAKEFEDFLAHEQLAMAETIQKYNVDIEGPHLDVKWLRMFVGLSH